MNTVRALCCLALAGCTASATPSTPLVPGGAPDAAAHDATLPAEDAGAAGDGASVDAAAASPDVITAEDATTDAGVLADASPGDAGAPTSTLGEVVGVRALARCPAGAPTGATCQQITVRGCPGIEAEAIDATVAVVPASRARPARGTITHFSGGGGQGFMSSGLTDYRDGGFRQVLVSWASDWEQTSALGIRAAGCRPATVLEWVFAEPSLHDGQTRAAFCAEGKSGGAGQLGYALAHYGMGARLDYVNLISGPPFARIDLGCDGDAPATAVVCGEMVTMRLPARVAEWENIPEPLTCGSRSVPAAELQRWRADSIAYGGEYRYASTRVEMFDCTNNATAVTGMSQLYYDAIVAAEGGTTDAAYHCYGAADGCRGEGLGATGDQAAIDAMLAGCTPRH